MSDSVVTKRKMKALDALKHLNEAGAVRPDTTVSQLLKATSDLEAQGGEADYTVLFDSDKYLLIMA